VHMTTLQKNEILETLRQNFSSFMNLVSSITSEQLHENFLASSDELHFRKKHQEKLYLLHKNDIIDFISNDSRDIKKSIADKKIHSIVRKETLLMISEYLKSFPKKDIASMISSEVLPDNDISLSDSKIISLITKHTDTIIQGFMHTYFETSIPKLMRI
jgi:hypothetical protein